MIQIFGNDAREKVTVINVIKSGLCGVILFAAMGSYAHHGEEDEHNAQLVAAEQEEAAPSSAVTVEEVEKLGKKVSSELYNTDRIEGEASAPVTIIEYASLTCHFCAAFSTQVHPRIKENYIDKGLVKMVVRPFVLNGVDFMGNVILQCVPNDETYYFLLGKIFEGREKWINSQKPQDTLVTYIKGLGVSSGLIKDCLQNKAAQGNVITIRKEATDNLDIEGTPTFYINGKKYSNMPYEVFAETLDKVLKEAKK